jgi:hypothetical protein
MQQRGSALAFHRTPGTRAREMAWGESWRLTLEGLADEGEGGALVPYGGREYEGLDGTP